MSVEADILKQLNSIIDNKLSEIKIHSKVCVVSNINETKRTCTCTPVNDDAEIFNVRLQAIISGTTGIFAVPKDGSKVIVDFFNDLSGAVTVTSEIDKFQVIADGKLKIEGNGTSLKTDILNELISVLKAAIITTPSGPGAFAPNTITALTAVDTKINTLLE